ncbi:hypothetical protein QFC22_002815 [Naganishia vaughanmartiniae]|uniref:Uncharacterized protein n=1 Tax=Naganishia vaughanmartiniae TaxID=1424756 RepID=A0ACC2XA36_9TREE|nr:hypothetical protein QFC22_002815 [Naganishia vaughanmartiniae]
MAEYEEYLTFALELAKKAGAMIREGQAERFRTLASPESKASSVDLVTEVDRSVETYIKDSIHDRYPRHKFLGEETYAVDKKMKLTDEYTWIVDPIDGTTNPLVGCSIGLSYKKVPIVGVINMPFLDQIYDPPLVQKVVLTPPLTSLIRPSVTSLDGGDRTPATMDPKQATIRKLVGDAEAGGLFTHGVRTLGCSAANITAVATGGLDIYWDNGCYPWDVCAGMVIIQESGGYATTGDPKVYAKGNVDIGDAMMGRRYCFVRAIAATENESSKEKQERLVKELLTHVTPWKTKSMAYLAEE